MTIAGTGLLLSLTLDPASLPADRWQDLALAVTFTNRGPKTLALHPGAALPAQRSGWGGPSFDVRLQPEAGGPRLTARELRTRYGPPGQPPIDEYFEPHRISLEPGASHRHVLHACWIPRASLRAEQLDVKVLDPEKMDHLDPGLVRGASALVLGETCGDLRPRAEDPELLRGNVVLFVPRSGRHRVTVFYAEGDWPGAYAGPDRRAESAPATLAIAGS